MNIYMNIYGVVLYVYIYIYTMLIVGQMGVKYIRTLFANFL